MSASPIFPIVTLLLGAIICYFVAHFMSKPRYTGYLAFLFLAACAWELSGGGSLTWTIGSAQTYLRVDSLSVLLSTVSLGLGMLVCIYSVGYMEHFSDLDKYYGLLLIMIAGILGIGLAGDLFNLFVFFEVMSIPSYILVGFEKDRPDAISAAIKYVIMSIFGTLIALTGIAIIFMYTGSLDLATLAKQTVGVNSTIILAAASLVMVGFGVKAAIFPLHTWLPDAHSAAPSGISAMLSGVVIEAGLITMIKVLTVLPGTGVGTALVILGVASMFIGNLTAIVQKDLKRMLAYSSIAQMGYIVMGIGLGLASPALGGFYGFSGGFLHIINNAIMKGGAFLCAGAILHSIGTRDLEEMRGIGRKIPLIGVSFAFFAFALAGIPPMGGFISEVFISKAGIDVGGWGIVATVMLVINSLLSMGYYVPAVNKMLLSSEISEKAKKAEPVPLSMSVPIVLMVILIILLGVFPILGLNVVEPAVKQMMAMVGG